MAKFCAKCGSELKEGSKFCVRCGAPVQGTPVQGMPGQGAPMQGMSGQGAPMQGMPGWNAQPGGMPGGYQQGAGSGMTAAKNAFPWKLLALIAVPVVLIVLILVLIFGGKGYEKPIEKLEKGMNEGKIDLVLEAFSPSIASSVSAYLPDDVSDMFPDVEIDLEIIGKEKLEKDDIQGILTEEYDVSSSVARRVKKAYILEVEMSAEDEEFGEPVVEEIPVVKLDGDWVIPISFM